MKKILILLFILTAGLFADAQILKLNSYVRLNAALLQVDTARNLLTPNWKTLATQGYVQGYVASNAPVRSVFGRSGNVVSQSGDYTTSQVTEGSNLYYTDARFDTRLATKTTTNLTEGSNLYYTAARFNTAFGTKTTTDLAEGSNLYFTNARARSAVTGTSPINVNSSTGVITYTGYVTLTADTSNWNSTYRRGFQNAYFRNSLASGSQVYQALNDSQARFRKIWLVAGSGMTVDTTASNDSLFKVTLSSSGGGSLSGMTANRLQIALNATTLRDTTTMKYNGGLMLGNGAFTYAQKQLHIQVTSGSDEGILIENTGTAGSASAAITLHSSDGIATLFINNASHSTNPALTGFYTNSSNGFAIIKSDGQQTANFYQDGSFKLPLIGNSGDKIAYMDATHYLKFTTYGPSDLIIGGANVNATVNTTNYAGLYKAVSSNLLQFKSISAPAKGGITVTGLTNEVEVKNNAFQVYASTGVITTNATTTTLLYLNPTIVDNSTGTITIEVSGWNATDGTGFTTTRKMGFAKGTGATVLGTEFIDKADEKIGTWTGTPTITWSVSANYPLISVTGQASKTITWYAAYKISYAVAGS